jgi:hypothetical protein
MKDYTGPYKLNMVWEDLSKDFLIKLMLIWHKAVMDFHFNWHTTVWAKTGDFKLACDSAREVWHKHAETILPLCAEAGKISVKTVADAHKAIMLMPENGTKSREEKCIEDRSVDYHQELVHDNLHRAWCNQCVWLDTMEALPGPEQEEQIKFICHDLCIDVYRKYIDVLLPEAKVNILKMPPRKSKDEVPVCEWEAVLGR